MGKFSRMGGKQGTDDNPRRMYAKVNHPLIDGLKEEPDDQGNFAFEIGAVTEGGTHHIFVLSTDLDMMALLVSRVFRLAAKKWWGRVHKKTQGYLDAFGSDDGEE